MFNIAKLFTFYGSMGSCKTSNLIVTNYNYCERGLNPIILTSSVDTRSGSSKVSSRIKGLEAEAISIHKNDNIFEIIQNMINENIKVDVVLVDEASFLSKQNIYELTEIVDKLNISVLAYGLRADFKGELFEGSQYLLAWSDEINEIKTMCHCGHKAIMNARIVNGKIVKNGEQIQVGGNESYIALCRKCWKDGKLK